MLSRSRKLRNHVVVFYVALTKAKDELYLNQGLPFEVTIRPPQVLSSEQQAAEWQEALGAY